MTTICAIFFSSINFVLILSSVFCCFIATWLFWHFNDIFDATAKSKSGVFLTPNSPARYLYLMLSFAAFFFARFYFKLIVLLIIFFVLLLVIAFCPPGAVTGMYFLIILNPKKMKVSTTSYIATCTRFWPQKCVLEHLFHTAPFKNSFWFCVKLLRHLCRMSSFGSLVNTGLSASTNTHGSLFVGSWFELFTQYLH